MVWVITGGIQEGDEFVLLDPEETRVLEHFFVELINTEGRVRIVDGHGRVFVREEENSDFWIHPYLMLRFPPDRLTVLGKTGYKTKLEFHINDGRKLHYLNHFKTHFPELYKKDFLQ